MAEFLFTFLDVDDLKAKGLFEITEELSFSEIIFIPKKYNSAVLLNELGLLVDGVMKLPNH